MFDTASVCIDYIVQDTAELTVKIHLSHRVHQILVTMEEHVLPTLIIPTRAHVPEVSIGRKSH